MTCLLSSDRSGGEGGVRQEAARERQQAAIMSSEASAKKSSFFRPLILPVLGVKLHRSTLSFQHV